MNIYPTANVAFSPDGCWLLCTTSASKHDINQKSALCFFQVPSCPPTPMGTPAAAPALPAKKMVVRITGAAVEGVRGEANAVFVKWLANTNQILCTTSTGTTKVFFDPRFSTKGAMLTAGRAAKREVDPADEVIGEIFNPHALPLFRNDEGMHPKRGRAYEKKLEAMKATVPERPAKSGPGTKDNMSFFFTKHVMEGRSVDSSRTEDPRSALLKYDALAKADPMFYGGAYGGTQPSSQLHTMTFEEEQEEFKKRQKRSLDI